MLSKNAAIAFFTPLFFISFLPGRSISQTKYLTSIDGFFNNSVNIRNSANWTTGMYDTSKDYTPSNSLPAAVTLEMPVPGDQGNEPSCGTWATIYAAGSYYMHLITSKPYSDSENLSPAFIYNQLPKGRNGITALVDNFKLFKTEGACSIKSMPYNADNYSTQPDSFQCLEATNYKIKDWQKLDPHNLVLLKSAVFKKRPVIFSITTDEGFDKITPPFIWKDRCGRMEQL